jgi:O-antigen/teichoic acid export membrane protein
MIETPSDTLSPGRRSIFINIIQLLTGSVFSQGLTALTLFITARQLEPAKYGQYTATLVLVTLLSIIFSLGLNILFLHEAGRKPSETNNLFGSVLIIKLGLGSIWFLLIVALSFLIDSEKFPGELLILQAAVVLLDNLFATIQAPLKASLRNKITSSLMIASDLLWFLATLFLIRMDVQSVLPFAGVRILTLIISLAFSSVILHRYYSPKIMWDKLGAIIKDSLPFAVSEIMMVSSKQIDVLIVALYLPQFSVGIYSLAMSIINAMFVPINAISFVILPLLSNAFARNFHQAWVMAKKSIWLHILVGALLTITVLIGANYIIGFLGPKFSYSQEIIKILSINLLLHSLIFALGNILISSGHQKERVTSQIASVVFNIVLNLIVVPIFGIKGAASIYVFTEMITLAAYTIFIRLLVKPK